MHWTKLTELGEVLQGTRIRGRPDSEGNIPIIQGRDLSAPRIVLDNLDKVELGGTADPIYSEANDVLIQRIGQRPGAYLVGEGWQVSWSRTLSTSSDWANVVARSLGT